MRVKNLPEGLEPGSYDLRITGISEDGTIEAEYIGVSTEQPDIHKEFGDVIDRANEVENIVPPELPVIFRKWNRANGGGIIAFFPTVPSDCSRWWLVQSYESVGQHASAMYPHYQTREATEEEYADLLAELKEIYETGEDAVRLKVYRRVQPWMVIQRETEWKRMMAPKSEAER